MRSSFHRCRCPNNHLFVSALIAVVIFLLFELTARIYDLYRDLPNIDIPIHFLAGIALGLAIYWFFTLTEVRKKKTFTLLLTILAAAIWETLETLEELVSENKPYLRDFFYWDGFWDIIVTLIGGVSSLLILHILRNRINLRR